MSFVEDSLTYFVSERLKIAPDDPELAAKTLAAQAALTLALDTVELYLDRGLEFQKDITEEIEWDHNSYLVRRFPIVKVHNFSHSSDSYQVDKARGMVRGFGSVKEGVSITYDGGYEMIPPPIQYILFDVATTLYPTIYDAGTSGAISTGQAIKSISTPDVGTISYYEGAAAAADGSGTPWAFISGAHRMLLDRYRAESVIGVG